MKKFKITTYSILAAAIMLLTIDCVYMARLYNAISDSIERDIRASLAELDVDELWYRSTHQDEYEHISQFTGTHGTVEGTLDDNGNFVVRRIDDNGDTIIALKHKIDESYNYANQIIKDMSMQMHFRIDPYLPIRLEPLDSLFSLRLASRGIDPKFYAVQLLSDKDSVMLDNPKLSGITEKLNRYELQFHSYTGDKYAAYVSSLTGMVLARMWGVLAFTAALILLFAFAFWYMWRFINRQRSLEEMKDSFVNSMTHELKTPIAVAYSAADSLQRYYDSSSAEHNKEYIAIIMRELSKHTGMVENILSMNVQHRKTLRLSMEDIEIRPVIEEICKNHRLKTDKQVEYIIDVEPKNLCIKADPMHFANIVSNLVENAIKYSGDSVNISITADAQHISVSDNGIGIAARHLPRIFERFYRVPLGENRYAVEGYGIGLYYVREMSQHMGWSIFVESKPGVGTTFNIKFQDDEA